MVRWEIPLLLTSGACALATATGPSYIEYSTVTGYFLQDLNSTNATTFDYVSGHKKMNSTPAHAL